MHINNRIARKAAHVALAAACALGAIAGGAVITATSASAHDVLVSTSPAAGKKVKTLPDQLELEFSAKIAENGSAVEVSDADGQRWDDGTITVDGTTVNVPLKPQAPAGSYDVVWRVVSSDGHPISGDFSFKVTQGAQPATDDATEEAPTAVTAPADEPSTAVAETPDATTTSDQATTAAGFSWRPVVVIPLIGALIGVGVGVVLSLRNSKKRRQADES